MKTHDVLRTGNMDEQSNYDYGETEECSNNRNLSENYGEHPEESTGAFDSPVD